uniref:ANK_REP_REGION domain-containing protein n=1 Tax=Macrostomum lignano TaxID=282301 RepID=A0A1I8F9F6_9PLAT
SSGASAVATAACPAVLSSSIRKPSRFLDLRDLRLLMLIVRPWPQRTQRSVQRSRRQMPAPSSTKDSACRVFSCTPGEMRSGGSWRAMALPLAWLLHTGTGSYLISGVSMNMAHWPVLTWLRASSVVLKNPQPDIRRNISVILLLDRMDNGQLSFNCDKFNKIKDKNELHDALDPEVSGSPQVNSLQPEGPGHLKRRVSLPVDSLQPEGPGHLKRFVARVSSAVTRYRPERPGTPEALVSLPVGLATGLKDPGTPEARVSLLVDSLQALKDPGHLKRLVSLPVDSLQLERPGHLKRLLGRQNIQKRLTSQTKNQTVTSRTFRRTRSPTSSNSVEAAAPELKQTEDAVDSLLAAVVGGTFLDVQRWLSHPASAKIRTVWARRWSKPSRWTGLPVVYQLLELEPPRPTGDAEFQSRLLTEAIRWSPGRGRGADPRPGRAGARRLLPAGETSLISGGASPAPRCSSSKPSPTMARTSMRRIFTAELHLSYAAQHGLCDIVRWLCTCARASRNIADTMEWTPINYAMWALEHLPEDRDADRRNLSEVIDILDDSVDK